MRPRHCVFHGWTEAAASAGRLACGLLLAILLAFPAAPAAAFDDATLLARVREELEKKEAELQKREERLKALEATIDRKIDEYRAIAAKAESYLKEIRAIQDEDLAHLIKTYEAMDPEAAAGRISRLDTALAVKVLRGMKTRKLGKVMARMTPSKAAILSKKMVAR